MNTPHERLTRTTFSLPLGEVHALVGGAVNARPLLFLHGFPDHPPTAVPFLEHLAETHRVVAPWLRGYAPSPIVGPYDLDTLAADALGSDPTKKLGVQQPPLPSPPNEKRGAEEYATTSMSIVMATMARSMPQFGLLLNTGRTSNAKCYQASLFRGGY
jgi:hypothetical protein